MNQKNMWWKKMEMSEFQALFSEAENRKREYDDIWSQVVEKLGWTDTKPDVQLKISNQLMVWYKPCASISFDVAIHFVPDNDFFIMHEIVGVCVSVFTKNKDGGRNYLNYLVGETSDWKKNIFWGKNLSFLKRYDHFAGANDYPPIIISRPLNSSSVFVSLTACVKSLDAPDSVKHLRTKQGTVVSEIFELKFENALPLCL